MRIIDLNNTKFIHENTSDTDDRVSRSYFSDIIARNVSYS